MVSLNAFTFLTAPGNENLGIHLLWVLLPLVVAHWFTYRETFAGWYRRLPTWTFAADLGMVVPFILTLVSYDYEPFIYFQF